MARLEPRSGDQWARDRVAMGAPAARYRRDARPAGRVWRGSLAFSAAYGPSIGPIWARRGAGMGAPRVAYRPRPRSFRRAHGAVNARVWARRRVAPSGQCRAAAAIEPTMRPRAAVNDPARAARLVPSLARSRAYGRTARHLWARHRVGMGAVSTGRPRGMGAARLAFTAHGAAAPDSGRSWARERRSMGPRTRQYGPAYGQGMGPR